MQGEAAAPWAVCSELSFRESTRKLAPTAPAPCPEPRAPWGLAWKWWVFRLFKNGSGFGDWFLFGKQCLVGAGIFITAALYQILGFHGCHGKEHWPQISHFSLQSLAEEAEHLEAGGWAEDLGWWWAE